MNLLDLGLLIMVVLAAVGGWRLGLVTRSLSWVGMALGLILTAALVPSLLTATRGAGRSQSAVFALGLLLGGALLGQAAGMLAGNRLNLVMRTPGARRIDSMGGAVAGIVGAFAVIWMLAPVAADMPGWPARAARNSEVAQAVDGLLPSPPNATSALRRLLGDSYPRVFDDFDPSPDVGRPPAATGISPATSARVVQSTVKVLGEACGKVQQGSGWVADTELVLTNAHVVAGESDAIVQRADGTRLDGTIVAFDPDVDLALIKVPGLDRTPLPLGDTDKGGRGGVYGHPGGGPLEISPFRVSERVTAVGTDIYDKTRTRRDVLVVAASLHPGDSGAALVDPDGEVVGVAFAIAPDRTAVAYALSVDELRPILATSGPDAKPVDTGRCTD